MTRPLEAPAAPWPRWLDGLSRGALVVLALVCVASLASYLLAPEQYTFGTEVGGWTYRSRAHYLSPLLAELCVLVGAGALSVRTLSLIHI